MGVEGLRKIEVHRACVEDINWDARAIMIHGQERILIAVSNFVQDKIGFELLLQSQRTMMMRDYGGNWIPKIYTDAGMKLAGLTDLQKLTKAQKKANNLRRKKISRYIPY